MKESPCPKREDKMHCNCWYDGKACCACGDPAMRVEPLIPPGADWPDGALPNQGPTRITSEGK